MWGNVLAKIEGPWRAILCTGAGFGLACGWVWFPGPQNLVLPYALWGTSYSGAGALFVIMTIAGFALVAWRMRAASSPMASSPMASSSLTAEKPLPVRYAGKLHIMALASMALGVMPFWPGHGLWAYAGSFFLGLASLGLGLFWVGAMLALTSTWPAAGGAFALACGIAALTTVAGNILQGSLAVVFCLLPPSLAWLLAMVPHGVFFRPRRPRGRPKISGEVETGVKSCRFISFKYLGVALLVFWLLALKCNVEFSPGAAEGLMACGALLGLWAQLRMKYTAFILLCFVLLARGMALLLIALLARNAADAPVLSTGFAGVLTLTEGAAFAALFGIFSGKTPMQACFVAASSLALLPLLSNAALLAGAVLTSGMAHSWALFLMGGGSALTSVLLLLLRVKNASVGQQKETVPRQTCAVATAFASVEKKSKSPGLTTQERSVLALRAQGLDIKAMALRLGVRQDTVRWHLRNIQRKGLGLQGNSPEEERWGY